MLAIEHASATDDPTALASSPSARRLWLYERVPLDLRDQAPAERALGADRSRC